MAARLKVFAARMGFFDTVVAAASQKAALAAWGVHQDLFKDGAAAATDDPAAQVALERPGVVLRRMAGSTQAYAETAELSADGLVPTGPKPGGKRSAVAARPSPAPDRSALDAAERALTEARRERDAAKAALDARRVELQAALDALDQEARLAAEAADRGLKRLDTEVERARAAYLKAGGR